MRCYSEEHDALVRVAYALIVVWPVGSLVVFISLAARSRQRLLRRTPDAFTRSTRFLHAQFKADAWYWAAVELAHRELVTGWVLLLVTAERSFLRIVVGLLVSLCFFSLTLLVRPYQRIEDNILAASTQFVLVALFIGSILIRVYEDTARHDAPLLGRGFAS